MSSTKVGWLCNNPEQVAMASCAVTMIQRFIATCTGTNSAKRSAKRSTN